MTRLLNVELSRLLSRRLFRLVAVLGLLAVLVVDGLIAARSSNNVAAAQASAKTELQQQYQACLSAVGQPNGPSKSDCDQQLPAAQLQQCLAQVTAQPGQGPTAADCRRDAGQNPYFQDPRFHFADHAKDLLTGAAFILMAVGLVVAASLIGAEWQAGTFASLLTWETRRQRVLWAKFVAAVVGVTALAAVVTAVLVAGAALAADTRGTMAGSTSHLWWQLASMYGRVMGLIALVTLIGAALAAMTRHTVAVVGIVGGYLIAGELVGAIVSSWWRNHALAAHLMAFIQGRFTYYVTKHTGINDYLQTQHHLDAGGAAVLVLAIAVVTVGAAAGGLSRRDVA